MYEWIAPSGVRVVSVVAREDERGWFYRLYQTMKHRINYRVVCSSGPPGDRREPTGE